MICVKEVLLVCETISVPVCHLFPDETATKTMKTNIGTIADFVVEPVSSCFSRATTRWITVLGAGDYSKIKTIEFV